MSEIKEIISIEKKVKGFVVVCLMEGGEFDGEEASAWCQTEQEARSFKVGEKVNGPFFWKDALRFMKKPL